MESFGLTACSCTIRGTLLVRLQAVRLSGFTYSNFY